jgi:YVTN family beta-propeller protein
VVAWGDNSNGQTTVPAGLSDVMTIAAGGYHTVALQSNGTVVVWGNNGSGQTTVPGGLGRVAAIAAGADHTVALQSDGTVVAWGYNGFGQTTVPAGLSRVTAIAGGGYHTVALAARVGGVALPTITAQPVSVTVNVTSNAVFRITATSTVPLSYQWRKEGVNVPSATNATLTLNNVQTNQAGNYTAVVSNFVGSVTSSVATLTVAALTVNPRPILTIRASTLSAPNAGSIYVCNSGENSVSVLSPSTLTVVTNIPVGASPGFVIVTPDGAKAYVANRVGNTISVIRTSTGAVIATIPVGTQPQQIAVSRDSRRVYVANRLSSTISIIDAATDTVLTNVPTGRYAPITLAFHPIRDEVWVGYNSGLEGGGAIEARSATDLRLLASHPDSFIYYASADLAFLPDGSEAYGAEGCGGCGRWNRISGIPSGTNITIIGGTLTPGGSGAALAVAVNPLSRRGYFAKQDLNAGAHRVVEFDRSPTPQFGRSLTFSALPVDLAVTPDGQLLFVVNQAPSGYVSVINTSNFNVVATVNVGNNPTSIAIKPHFSLASAEVQICWNSLSNTLYAVEYKSGLTATDAWIQLGTPVIGNGSTNCISDPVLNDRQRVYRVRLVE